MTNNRHIVCWAVTVACLMTSVASLAQDNTSLTTESQYLYDDMMQPWRTTQNASCLTLDSVTARGYAEFTFLHGQGSYHRVQEGSGGNAYGFFTERYQHIGKYLYGYGSFRFSEGRTKNRAWSDVMRTYESNPFISGSDVPASYDEQSFDLKARVGTVALQGWRFGMGLDYTVGDLSRLRDPRSRSRLLDYKLSPSLSYSTDGHTIAMAGYYNRRKEKMPSLTTVQNNPNLYYYQMSGLDAASGSVGGYSGFQREYVDHAFGGEVEYGYRNDGFVTVNSLGVEKSDDYIYEQYRREPGRYTAYRYALASSNRIVCQNVVHEIDLDATWQQGYADEYRPQLVITTDKETGYNSYHYENLLTFKKRYQYEAKRLNLHYRLNMTELSGDNKFGGGSIRNYVGVSATLSDMSQKHLLPLSTFDVSTVMLNAEYGQALLKGNRLWITVDAGYLVSNKADINLANEKGEYAMSVLMKDMDYYSANAFRGMLSLKYQLPIKVKKTKSMFYVKAFGETWRAQHSLDRTNVGFAIGVFN